MTFPSGAWGFSQPGLVEAQIVIIEGTKGGLFVYNGTPGLGTLIFSVVPPAVTHDKYGNPTASAMQAGDGSGAHLLVDDDGNLLIFNFSDKNVIQLIAGDGSIRVYPATGPGLQQLQATVSPIDGTTADGDEYAAGVGAYTWISGVENGVRLFNGEFQFISWNGASWDIDASFFSSATAITNSLLPLAAEDPANPGVTETWHTLGSPSATGYTSDHGRYRLTPDGEVEIDILLHGTAGSGTAGTYTYANNLATPYIPAFHRWYPLGAAGVLPGGANFPRVSVDTTGQVVIVVPAATGIGANVRMPLD